MNEDKTPVDETTETPEEAAKHQVVRVVLKSEPGSPKLVSEREAQSLGMQGLLSSAATLNAEHSGTSRTADGEVVPEGVARDEHDTATGDLVSGADDLRGIRGEVPEDSELTAQAGDDVPTGDKIGLSGGEVKDEAKAPAATRTGKNTTKTPAGGKTAGTEGTTK